MRIAINRGASLLGIFVLLVLSSHGRIAQASTGATGMPQCTALKASAPGIRTSRGMPDGRLNATLDFSLTRDGAIRMVVKAGELEAEKKVYPDGHLEIILRAEDDAVKVTVTRLAIDVERRDRRHRVDPRVATDDEWVRVNQTLAGSKAVRLLRMLAEKSEIDAREAPGAVAILTMDATLGVLSGDVAAANRLGRRMQAAQQGRIRPAGIGQEFLDCYRKYSEAVVVSMNEFGQCYVETPWWDPYAYLCSFEWMLKAESAWFQFISCSAFPLRVE